VIESRGAPFAADCESTLIEVHHPDSA